MTTNVEAQKNIDNNSEAAIIKKAGESLNFLEKESKSGPKAVAGELEQNLIPPDVDEAAKWSNLDEAIKGLKEYAESEKLSPDGKICLQDCIKRKFEDVKEDIRKVPNEMSVEKFMENNYLSINEETTPQNEKTGIKWKKSMTDQTKMLVVSKYNETIFPLLGIKDFVDSSVTLGESVVNNQFIDNKSYSENFELNEKFEKETEGKQVGLGILEAIAKIEGRILEGNYGGEIQNIREVLENEIGKISDNNERKIAQELWLSINEKLGGDDDLRISMEDRAYLFAQSMIFMGEYRVANPDIIPTDLYQLLNSNQNKLLHQHLWDVNTITSSDHGIKHVLRGDLTFAENVFNQITNDKRIQLFMENNGGKSPSPTDLQQFQSRLRVLTMQATLDHDLGYTNVINRKFDQEGYDKAYYMQSDHPLWSTIYIQNNAEWYKKYFGEEGYKILIDTIPGHGVAKTESFNKIAGGTANSTEFVSGILSTVDCAGSPADYKISYMFAQKEVIGSLFNVYSMIQKKDTEGIKNGLNNLAKTVESMPEGEMKDSWLMGIKSFLKLKDGELSTTDLDFYCKKFLGAYGVRTSINMETGNPECGINEDGGWKVSFELAGKSFEYISNKFGIDIALNSFISVCDDYGISKKGKTINAIKEIIKNKDYEIGELDEGTSIEKTENGIIIKGPNNIEITLNFNGKSYEGFDDSIEKINTINQSVDDLVDLLNENENNLSAIVSGLQKKLANLGYYLDANNFSGHENLLKDITDKIVNLSNSNYDEIINQVEQIRTSYHFKMRDVGSSILQ